MEGTIGKIPDMIIKFVDKHGRAPNCLLVGPDKLRIIYQELEYISAKRLIDMDYKEIRQRLFGLNLIRTKDKYFSVALGE